MRETIIGFGRLQKKHGDFMATVRHYCRTFTEQRLGPSFVNGDYPYVIVEQVKLECAKTCTQRSFRSEGQRGTMLDYYLTTFGYVLNRAETRYKYKCCDNQNRYPDVVMTGTLLLDKDLHPEVFNFIWLWMMAKKQRIRNMLKRGRERR